MQAHSRVSAFTCLWLLASAAPTLALQPAAPTVAGVAKTTRPAVVTIKTPTGTGSGVIVDPAGVIVTNLHVVQGDRAATIVLENGDSYDDVSVVDVDARRDIVLLKIKAFGLTAIAITAQILMIALVIRLHRQHFGQPAATGALVPAA